MFKTLTITFFFLFLFALPSLADDIELTAHVSEVVPGADGLGGKITLVSNKVSGEPLVYTTLNICKYPYKTATWARVAMELHDKVVVHASSTDNCISAIYSASYEYTIEGKVTDVNYTTSEHVDRFSLVVETGATNFIKGLYDPEDEILQAKVDNTVHLALSEDLSVYIGLHSKSTCIVDIQLVRGVYYR